MQQTNDFYTYLNAFLSKQCIIQQCVIKDYATDGTSATCTVVLPQNSYSQGIYKNINCFVGSPVDIVFDTYMSGIVIRQQTQYNKANDIEQRKETKMLGYFNSIDESMIAIILPNVETLPNIKEALIKADHCYFGNTETNILDEFSEYVSLMKGFFEKLAMNAPTIALQPGAGAATIQSEAQVMQQKSDELYQKLTKITKKQ